MKTITFVTSNASKAQQVKKHLGIDVDYLDIEVAEIQSLDVNEVIEHKLREAYQVVDGPVMVDDTGFTVHAMGEFPGPLMKYFANSVKNSGVCKIVSLYEDKSATGFVSIGYYDGKTVKIVRGEVHGIVSDKPKGKNGFGWDPILIPDGYSQTRGEMSETDYDDTSPRKEALDKMRSYLKRK